MKCSQPTAAQKRWREAVRELGSVISGGPAVIHHPVGRTAKHNKVEIGHWWLIPLTDEEHKALHNGNSPWLAERYLNPWREMTRKEFEKAAFEKVMRGAEQNSINSPPSDAVLSILEYHR